MSRTPREPVDATVAPDFADRDPRPTPALPWNGPSRTRQPNYEHVTLQLSRHACTVAPNTRHTQAPRRQETGGQEHYRV